MPLDEKDNGASVACYTILARCLEELNVHTNYIPKLEA